MCLHEHSLPFFVKFLFISFGMLHARTIDIRGIHVVQVQVAGVHIYNRNVHMYVCMETLISYV